MLKKLNYNFWFFKWFHFYIPKINEILTLNTVSLSLYSKLLDSNSSLSSTNAD